MFGNLMAVAGVIAIFWLIIFVIYLYTSHQQRSIVNEVEALEKKLDEENEQP